MKKPEILREKLNNIAIKELNKTVTELKYLGGGSYGKVYRTALSDGEVIAIKLYREPGMNENEAFQLKLLSANTHVKMPDVLFTYADGDITAMGMTFIPGRNVLDPRFLLNSRAEKQSFAEEVIKGMLDWHGIKGEAFGDLKEPRFSSWHDCYRSTKAAEILDGIEKLYKGGKFSGKKYDLICRATELYDKCEEEPASPVLIHSDLNIMNIMADKRTLKLNGFIDPCSAMWADREYDLFQLRNMWGDSFYLYETYKKMCGGLSAYSDFRVAYYGTMNEVSCRLNGGPVFPVWEDLWFDRLKKEMK